MCVEEIDIDAADLCNEKTRLRLDPDAETPTLKCENISIVGRQVFVLPVTCQGESKVSHSTVGTNSKFTISSAVLG